MTPGFPAAPPPEPLRITIVAGLHTEARAATVERLLATVPGSVALHHDLSAAVRGGTAVRTVRDALGVRDWGEVALADDCACCALRDGLVAELRALARARTARHAVVELWDSVEPRAVAETIARHGGAALTLTPVVTAVDPTRVLSCLGNGDDLKDARLAASTHDRRTVADTWARQMEYADILSVREDPAVSERDRELLGQLHPTARRVPQDTEDWARVLSGHADPAAAAAAQHPATARLPWNADRRGVGTLVWRRRRPFHPGRLYEALGALARAAVRSRGRFWLADRPDALLSWDAAGGTLCLENAGPWLAALPETAWDGLTPERRAAATLDWRRDVGDRCQVLAFTSPALDRAALERLLDSCLLTEAEYAAGRAAWKRLPRTFDAFLEPSDR
ncbi:CobW family GTP-binding protein [Streptomyces sp. NPDC057638]|uniref:CobW family GTP-binding protein n=1 Tax=Streptomyces sp. NPDC057638 TaxID=3346190 RepID=UPI0036A1C6C1